MTIDDKIKALNNILQKLLTPGEIYTIMAGEDGKPDVCKHANIMELTTSLIATMPPCHYSEFLAVVTPYLKRWTDNERTVRP